ncbi:hypothetical protein SCLCIDRAFT_1221912 [Scleroderma citrinum Foug A]|uniref:Uncharacterized protein n=1 Tax=Scleroderma citrinum Foug A TaxID=1036808 RepID=A0A0C3DDQ2_9AGAM|nr:hypothetical protein SCLCIDRAFT_1221912 [Scleroderma citrinum Foug A]
MTGVPNQQLRVELAVYSETCSKHIQKTNDTQSILKRKPDIVFCLDGQHVDRPSNRYMRYFLCF